MNWLGLTWRAFFATILGAWIGGLAYAAAFAKGWDAPYLVGIGMGLGALLASPDRSGMRGLLVATGAIWVATIVQTRVGPYAGTSLLDFHATLTVARFVAFMACAATAFVLARASARRNAPERAAGA